MMLSVRFAPNIMLNVAITETGIENDMMTVAQKFCRKKYRMMMARMPPMTAFDMTSFTACVMNVDWSDTFTRSVFGWQNARARA